MKQINLRFNLFLATFSILLSIIVLLINHFVYGYYGNSFFPDKVPEIILILVIFNTGLLVLFGKHSALSQSGLELLYYIGIMCVIAFATNAVQLTPFSPIDKSLYDLELHCGVDLQSIVQWTNQYAGLKTVLGYVYDSLPWQMSMLPLVLIVLQRFQLLHSYYFLLLFTMLIGFTIYYFFPTTAPASILNSSLFSEYQIATGLKFNQIHHHLLVTTGEGGLIAFPSFHTVWALLCVYLLKDWPVPCALLFVINCVLLASCVLLGWHYLVDVLAGILLLLLGFYFLRRCVR